MVKLQDMRDHRHLKWPVYIFFGIVIISFIFFYGWKQGGQNGGDPNARFAKLRSESLSPLKRWTYVDGRAMALAQQEAQMDKAQLLPQQWLQMLQQQNVLERMITPEDIARTAADGILAERAADKMKVSVTAEEVIGQMKARRMSDEQLNAIAQSMDMSPHAFIEWTRRQQEIQRVEALKTNVAHASLFELWQEYSLANEKLVLDLAAYPAENFESKVQVSDQDLQAYLDEHKEEFHVPAMRRYAYVKVGKEDLAKQITPTDAELQTYYQQNQSQFVRKPAWRIEEIYSPLGQDSASTPALAALRNVRPQAEAEGDWTTLTQTLNQQTSGTEFFRRSNWVQSDQSYTSEQMIARLQAMGDNKGTTLVTDSEGLHLVRVLEQRKEGAPPLAEIRPQVEGDYKNAKAEEQFNKEVERFQSVLNELKQAKDTTFTLHTVAERLKLDDELTTKVEAASATIPGVGAFDRDLGYIKDLMPNEVSDVLNDGATVAVIQVVDQAEGYDPKLAEVREKVEQAVRRQKAVELARAAAEQSMNAVTGGAEFATAVADAPKPPVETGEFTRLEPVQSLGAPLINFKQQTLKINVGSTGMSAYGGSEEKPEGYAVWKVKKLVEPKQEDFAKERAQFEQDYLQVQRETIVREWLADQRRQADYQMMAEQDRP